MRVPKSLTVAIVAFLADVRNAEAIAEMAKIAPCPVPRVVFYQVSLDPDRLSPEGEFIRFGSYGDGKGVGDEITGWIPLTDIEVVETLAIADADGVLRPVVQQAQSAA